MTLKILTANRLGDGAVVYLADGETWSEWLTDARIAGSEADAAALEAIAEQAVKARQVVGPYLVPVETGEGRPRAVSQRERIRARGPTVRPDLGKPAVRPCLDGGR